MHDLEVRSTGDARQAIEVGRQFRPQVLLCDWWLGCAEDGVQVARALSNAIDDLKILFMTGHSRENLGRLCSGLAVRAVYQKPVRPSDLRAEIENMLD
jgi:DNA-binding response OmpR family regulator